MFIKSPTLSTARQLDQHRAQSVAATRAALQRTIRQRRVIDGERRLAAFEASREALQIAERAGDRASSTQISCARKLVDCG